MGLRKKELATELIARYQLLKGFEKVFSEVFGPFDTIEDNNESAIFTYYFGGICERGKILAHGGKCYAKFYFKSDALDSTGFNCE